MRTERDVEQSYRTRPGDSEVGTLRERRAWAFLLPSADRARDGYDFEVGVFAVLPIAFLAGLFNVPMWLAGLASDSPFQFVGLLGAAIALSLVVATAAKAAVVGPVRALALHVLGIGLTLAFMTLGGFVLTKMPDIGYGIILLSVLVGGAAGIVAWNCIERAKLILTPPAAWTRITSPSEQTHRS